jgi:hypothetical protein
MPKNEGKGCKNFFFLTKTTLINVTTLISNNYCKKYKEKNCGRCLP